jgi:hypothetical protein
MGVSIHRFLQSLSVANNSVFLPLVFESLLIHSRMLHPCLDGLAYAHQTDKCLCHENTPVSCGDSQVVSEVYLLTARVSVRAFVVWLCG